MIVNSNDKQISGMLSLLNKLGIPAQDCELAERYLNGTAGDEVLDRFGRMDLTMPYVNLDREGYDIIKKLNKNISTETGVRFMNVAFAIGRGSCASIFWSSAVDNVEEFALYKRMIIGIHRGLIGPVPFLGERSYEILMNMAQNSKERVKEAVPFLKKEGEIYGATGLAMYFCKKYEKPGGVTEEDEPLMAEYEDMILKSLDNWLAGHGCTAHEEIVNAVRGQQRAAALADRIDMCSLGIEDRRDFCAVSSLSYLNFQLSELLTEVFRVCMAVNEEITLCSTRGGRIGSRGMRTDIMFHGGDYDELFGMKNQVLYICWAAHAGSNHILRKQLAKNTDSYLKALDTNECENMLYTFMRLWGHGAGALAVTDAAARAIEKLRDVLKSENPDLYRQTVQAVKPNHERMIKQLVPDTPHAELAREYLRGSCGVSDLYPYDEEFATGWAHGYGIPDALKKYQKHCNDKTFFDRCRVWLVIRHFDYIGSIVDRGCTDKQCVKNFFDILDREQLDAAHQLWGFILLYKGQYSGSKAQLTVTEAAEEVFAEYLEKRRGETIQAFSGTAAEGRYLGLRILGKDAEKNKQEILSYTEDGSKLVKNELLDILYSQKDWEKDIVALLDAKKAGLRELAVHVLVHWQQEGRNYNKVLLQAMEKEKNAKVLALLQGALNIQEGSAGNNVAREFSKEELIGQLHKGGRKRSLAWAYDTPFSTVHRINGETAEEQYLQAVLLCYVLQDECGFSKNAEILAQDLQADEFAAYANELFDKWLEAGADAKKRWVLYAASIHGGSQIIQKIYHQIQEWPQAARGAIAAEAVKALALNPAPRALLIVDSIARKFKFKQVKAAAGEALEFAASQLGISREELADRIVPDLGFNENMERIFNYGTRTFRVMLTPALEAVVYDEGGKKLKNLPAPAKKDDAEKAAAAYEDFKTMKKELKTVVSSQRARLEYALSVKREWATDAWKALFVKNPLMHQFAIGLIWGIYENGSLTRSFRYMEDGSFNTEDEEEYTLPENAKIGLVHPVELSEESKAAWKQQLEDYEITQPVEQLDRAVYIMTGEEKGRRSMERFGGFVLNDLSLNGKLTGLGWYRGSVQDAGGFYTYYREDAEIGMGVELHFSGSFIGMYGEDVTIYDVRFYKAGEVARGSYVYDEADKDKAYFLKDVPARYFSEIVLQLTKATASSEERDEDWKKNVTLIN